MSSTTSTSAGPISNDHVDLLVTATSRYGVLANPTTAAFSPARARAGMVATATDAGRILLEHYRAAQRWRASIAGGTLDVEEPPYAYRPVDRFEPIEVVKASHCYEHVVRDSPVWPGSSAQRLVEQLIRAATCRLPGYLEAAWEWTRPAELRGAPVGLCRTWRPVEQGVRWVGPGELAEAWDTAALVLITVEALADLPHGLARRSGVYLCTDDRIDEAAWPLLAALPSLPDVVIMLPPGLGWLEEQLRHPASAHRRSAICPSPWIPVG